MKNNKKKQTKKTSNEADITILGMGHYDIEYKIELTNEELMLLEIENIGNLSQLQDYSFLIKNPNLLNQIEINTQNQEINTLLFMNRSLNDNNKLNIEYIAYETPIFTLEEKEFEELFNKVNKRYNFNVKKRPLFEGKHNPITLTIINKSYGENNSIKIGTGTDSGEHYLEKESKAQKTSNSGKKLQNPNNYNKNNQNKEEEEEQKSIFDKIFLRSKQYNYFISFIHDIIEIEQLDDFIDFINKLKSSYNANIIINFSDTTQYFSSEEMSILNRIYLLTDTTISDINDAVKNYNQHSNKYQTKQKKDEEIKKEDIEDYYIQSIACRGALSITCSKVGFFLDENFSKISIIEVPNDGKALKMIYDIKAYPKITPQNVDKIGEYKNTLRDPNNRDFYKSVFYGGLLGRFCSNNNKEKGIKDLYPSYMSGCELLKRVLELNVNGYPITLNSKYYIVRLDKKELDDYIKKFELNDLENKFVLDCLNAEKSKMKYYVPLFDYNLHGFFGSKYIQSELLKKGFITNKGYVNYDPYYRAGMGVQKEKKKININKNEEILKKQIEKNEINTKEKIILKVSPTNKKLPTKNCLALSQMDNYEHQHVHRGEKSPDRKCQYCILGEHSKFLEDIEDKKRKKMQLRRYDTDE